MPFSLQTADVQNLMAQPSPHMRAMVAGKLAREIDSVNLTPNELAIAQDIVRLLAKDLQMIVRKALADNLRHSKRLPHDVAWQLANDVEAVALPILLDCEILTHENLLMLIRTGSLVKQKAIASRPNLPESVTNEIISTCNETVVVTLVGNNKTGLSDEAFNKVLDRFSKSDAVKEGMVRRARLPVKVAERLVTMVSTQLKNYLVQHHELPPAMAEEFAQQARERAAVQLGETSIEEIEQLVAQMHKKNRLTPTLAVRALCMGNLAFFEFGMAALAGLPVINTRALIHDPGNAALASLWEKAAMPAQLLPLARTALEVMRQLKLDGEENDMQRFRSRIIERVLTQMGGAGPDEMDYLLDLLQ